MQCRCRSQMRVTTKRGDTRYLECGACGRRAQKTASRDAEWSPPSQAWLAMLDDQRRNQIIATLAPFSRARGRRIVIDAVQRSEMRRADEAIGDGGENPWCDRGANLRAMRMGRRAGSLRKSRGGRSRRFRCGASPK
jgi:hypothetical protein